MTMPKWIPWIIWPAWLVNVFYTARDLEPIVWLNLFAVVLLTLSITLYHTARYIE